MPYFSVAASEAIYIWLPSLLLDAAAAKAVSRPGTVRTFDHR
jgi:hypothetical protein